MLLGDHKQAKRSWQECDQWREIRRADSALPNNLTGLLSAGRREKILKLLASLCAGTKIDENQGSKHEGASKG